MYDRFRITVTIGGNKDILEMFIKAFENNSGIKHPPVVRQG